MSESNSTKHDLVKPESPKRRFRMPALAAGALAIAVIGVVGTIAYTQYAGSDMIAAADVDRRTQPVRRMDLDITVKQEGELEAVRNIEIRNEVQGRRTITYLINEGTRVQAGDTLAVLDSQDLADEIDSLEQQLSQQEMVLNDEQEDLDWQLTQSAADMESAQVSLSLAEMDLAKFEKGILPKQLADANATLDRALSNLEREQETLQTSLALFGRGFVTAKKVKTDRQSVVDAERNVGSARIALEVLVKYEQPMTLESKKNSLRQAKNNVERVRDRSRNAELNSRQQVDRAQERVDRVAKVLTEKRQQLAACTITAPDVGLVVYRNDGRNPIAEGEQVHHRQTLMLLPDTDRMKAVVRVPENRVSQLRKGMQAVINKPVEGFAPLTATVEKISVLAESNGQWFNRDSREYPVELMLSRTPDGLKPGLKVEATVFVERMKDVLAVPLSCVYTQADKAFVFVRSESLAGLEPREIDLGRSNETHAQVLDGLAGGESVLELQVGEGRSLLERFGLLGRESGGMKEPTPESIASGDYGPAGGQ